MSYAFLLFSVINFSLVCSAIQSKMIIYTFEPKMVSFSLVNVNWALVTYLVTLIILINDDGPLLFLDN